MLSRRKRGAQISLLLYGYYRNTEDIRKEIEISTPAFEASIKALVKNGVAEQNELGQYRQGPNYDEYWKDRGYKRKKLNTGKINITEGS